MRTAGAFDGLLFRPRCAVATAMRSAHDRARHSDCLPVHPRAGRQQSHVLSARRGGGGARRRKAGTLYTLSTLSGCSLEDVRKATPGPAWYQLYLCRRTRRGNAALSSGPDGGLLGARR